MARSITSEWPCAMSMTSTSAPALTRFGGPLQVVAGRADGGADAQPALLVARGERLALLLDQVLGRHEPEQRPRAVDERQLLDLALDHHPLCAGAARSAPVDDELARAASSARLTAVVGDTNLTSRSVSSPFSRRALVDHDQRADPGSRHQRRRLPELSRPAPTL